MKVSTYFQQSTSAAPLVVFRVVLGLLLFGSVIRFWAHGWIHELYIEPKYFFPYYGFEFVKPLGEFTYILFAICAVSALMVAIGLYYRIAATTLFVSFTYIELIDKSTYLNHYYFISILCLMMIFLPAHVCFSVDAHRNKKLAATHVPQCTIDSLKLLAGMVYLFAGLAKINSDWLLEAQPLRIWLPAKNDLPFIGPLFNYVWVAYAFSWLGCVYDVSIPFLLMKRATRIYAYGAVIIFHVLTSILFPIGMFPYIMIGTALIFFSPGFHIKLLDKLAYLLRTPKQILTPVRHYGYGKVTGKFLVTAFCIFFLVQIAMPFRHVLYPGELFWTEEGYRFSWRVMLMEKAGYAQFTVRDRAGRQVVVNNRDFLTPLQEKMMATQADMILQYAHLLREHFLSQGFQSPQVYVDSYVALNGRLGKPMIDPAVDLASQTDSFNPKPWILAFGNDIKGF